MSRRYIDWDPNSGIAHFVDTDETTGISTFGVAQDVDVIIEENRKEYNGAPHRWGELTRVARFPLAMYEAMQREGKTEDQEYMRRWLNDSDNRAWRTRPGNV